MKSPIQALAALTLLGTMALVPAAFSSGTSDALPTEISAGIFLRLQDDAGVQAVFNAYKRRFLLSRLGEKAESVVEDFSLVKVEEISVGILNALGPNPKMVLVGDIVPGDASVSFKFKGLDFKLNIKERSEEKGLQDAIVKALLRAWISAPDRAILDNDLVYSPSLEEEGKVCAYALNGNRVVVSNDLKLAQDTLAGGPGVKRPGQIPGLAQLLNGLEGSQDILLYINNLEGALNRLNERMEAKRKIPILMNVQTIESAGIFFDIVDEDHVEVRGHFLTQDSEKLAQTVDDLAFLFEFFRRKLLRQGVVSKVRVNASADGVEVRMHLTGTALAIADLFNPSMLAGEGKLKRGS